MSMITKAQRDEIMERETKLREWMGKRSSYHPSELPVTINPPTNEERSAVELFDWIMDPPKRYFAYAVKEGAISNWMGESLGTITWEGATYRDNMGGKRKNFRMLGTNGIWYSGTAYVSSGDYCRLKAIKS